MPQAKRGRPRNSDLWDVDSEVQLLRHFARTNFWFFFLHVFGAGDNSKGQLWIEESIHRPLCEWFQFHVDDWFARRAKGIREKKHLAVLIPRGMGKTTMVTQAGQLWLHLRDPEMSSFTSCESTALASKILDGMKAVLEGSDPTSLFARLFGNWGANARSWSAKQATHSARKNTSRKDPSLGVFSVETSIVGAHPDAIFYDDPISYERLTTDANWLDTVNSQLTSLIPVLQVDGLMVMVGTRYDDMDQFGRCFADDGVKSLVGMPTDSVVVDTDGVWDVYFLSARDKEGKPISSKTWPEHELKKYEKRDPLRYAAQVLNDPSLSESNPITREMLEKECVVKSDDVPWGVMSYAICCDTAFWDGKSKARKDETCCIVLGYPRDYSGDVYHIESYGSNLWRGEDLANRLVSIVQRYRKQGRRVKAITDEVTMSGKKGTWEANLRNYFADVGERMPQFIEFQRGGSNKKITRIVSAIQYAVHGHFKFVENSPGMKELIDQMVKIEQMKHNPRIPNDRVDAWSDGFQAELYVPMRTQKFTGRQKPPWEHGSELFAVDGLDPDDFKDNDFDRDNPRPVIK